MDMAEMVGAFLVATLLHSLMAVAVIGIALLVAKWLKGGGK